MPAKKNTNKPDFSSGSDAKLIIELLQAESNRAFSFKQIAKSLATNDKAGKIQLAQTLDDMVEAGQVEEVSAGNYQLSSDANCVVGTVDFVNPRFAFVISEEFDEDIRIPVENLNLALDGDKVKVKIYPKRRAGRHEGKVIAILERKNTSFVGKIEISRQFAFVIPDSKKMHFDIFVGRDGIKEAKHGDKVIVKILEWGDAERNPVGEVIDVLGAAGNNDTEMHAIMAEYGLPYKFESVVEAAADKIPAQISTAEIAKRRDMRAITTFTIDPIDAKDFDDALSVRQLENGNWEIGVHIADVSHYVTPGSILDQEAYNRATSVYLVDRVVPMLPEKLSNGLCSLRPNEDKLTFSAVFELDKNARIKNEWFGRTVIHSDHRFTYEEVQEVIETGQGYFQPEIHLLNTLAYKLREDRFRKGSIGFETPEVRFQLDEQGKPLSVIPKERKDAHKLIEDFMLLANKRVAEYVHNMRKGKNRNTMVYRIHEAPDSERIRIFSAFAQRFGYKISLEDKQLASSLNAMIEAVEGKPEMDVLQKLAVRTMAKARYSTQNVGHFGLAFKFYSHFTSPIRRYPDVLAHRLLQHYIEGGEPVDAEDYEARCKHSSDMERKAAEAERASIKYKQVEFMQLQEQNKVYEGIISGLTDWGVYVEIIETKCEGMVRLTDIQDDYYEIDKENYRMIGQRTKRIIAFGDKVNVRLKDTNLEKRTIDLEMISEEREFMRSFARKRSGGGGKFSDKKKKKY